MKKPPFFIWSISLICLLSSCNLDNLDFNKLSNETNLAPEFIIPVANANISVWDLIQSANTGNEDVITKDLNGLVKIVYKKDNLFNYNVHDFLTFPSVQTFSSGDKVLGDILPEDLSTTLNIGLNELVNSVNGALDTILPLNGFTAIFPGVSASGLSAPFDFDPIVEFKTITLSNGTLKIKMENQLKVPITIKGSFYDIGYNRKITDFTFADIQPNETSIESVSLAGIQLSNQVEFRLVTFNTPGSIVPVKISLNDYFRTTFSLTDPAISQGNLIIKSSQTIKGSSGVFGFNFPEPDLKAFSAVLKKGSLSIKTSNTSQLTGTINFKLNEIKKNGVPVEAKVPLSGNSTTIDLSGAFINFSSDATVPYNRIPYLYSVAVNPSNGFINYSSNDLIKMDISLSNLEFKSITGDFGSRSIEINKGIFNLNVDLLNKIDGSFKLANPNLILTIRNSIGMPASIGLGLTGYNKSGQSVILTRNPSTFDIPVPVDINSGIATGTINFNKQNSNIVDFVALPPSGEISYSGKVDFNKSNPVTQQKPNFLDVDAIFSIDLAMELPLEMQMRNMAFRDTSGIKGSDYDKIETANLIINAKNGIPLDVDLQLLFVDTISNIHFGESKITKILSAAQVNASGVITPVQSTQTFNLDKNEMENLRKANGIIFVGTISSPTSGTTIAPIMADSKIELSVVIKSKVNL
jgi:hypothetical protein